MKLDSKDFLKSVELIIENVKPEQQHREYLKLFSDKGLRFSHSINESKETWLENYTDKKFEPRINLIERLPNILVIEFDSIDDGLQPSEALELSEKFVKKQGWAYMRSSHKGKCDYLWLESGSAISEADAKRFLAWLCPKGARIDANFASPIKVFPVLFAPHRKHPHNETPLYIRPGKKLNLSRLNLPKVTPKTQKTKTKTGFVYETFSKNQSQPPNDILEILQNPNLFADITITELDKKIVGEIETRKVVFLCGAGGRLVENAQIASFNLLVNDDAGAGKDYVVKHTLSILPKEFYVHKTRISPTVFTYWHNSQYEPEWTWDGKVFYPEDISESVLNCDVFKVMASGGSSATITIKQRAYDIEIRGKPIIITTTASATPNPEVTRRFVILNIDSSENQTKAIMARHSTYREKGIVPEYDSKYTEAMKYLRRVNVRIKFASLIDQHFPTKNIIMRTNYPRFLDFISASTAFHQYQREIEDGFVLATGQDYDLARECFLKLCSNRYMIPLTINQKKILKIFEKEPNLQASASQFLPFMKGSINTLKSMQTNLRHLVRYGLLEDNVGKDSYGRDLEVFSLSSSYEENESFDIPTYEEICRNRKLSKISKISKISKVSKPSLKKTREDGLHGLHVIPNLSLNQPVQADFSEKNEFDEVLK